MKLQSLLGKKASALALKTYVKKTYPKRFRKFSGSNTDGIGCLRSYANGIEFKFEGKPLRLATIFLYSGGFYGYKRYRSALPGGIKFHHKRKDVRALLGAPAEYSNGGKIFCGRIVRPWDVYSRSNVRLHFQYHHKTGYLTMVTLMSPAWTEEAPLPRKFGCIQDKIQRDSV